MTNELFYEISGEDQNCLQVILKQNEALIADSTSVCWFSENLDIENMDSMWSVFFGWRTDLLRLKNKALSPVVVGLAVPQNGRILALGFAGTSTRGLFCFKESFVAANSETTVEIRPFPQQSFPRVGYNNISAVSSRLSSMRYCTLTQRSQVFLQSGGQIMCKQLNAGDSMVVNFWCIVAFETTCVVCMTAHPQLPFYASGIYGVLTTVRGPGKVYLSAHGGGSRSNVVAVMSNGRGFGVPTAGHSSPFMSMARMVIAYVAFYVFISSLAAYMLFDEDFLQSVEDYLKRLDNIRREDGGQVGVDL